MTKIAQLSDPPGTERPVLQMLEINQARDGNDGWLSDPVGSVRPVHQMTKIDRYDNRGNIREHSTRDGHRTICGLKIGFAQSQPPCGNAPCKRCEKIAARCQIAAPPASGKQTR